MNAIEKELLDFKDKASEFTIPRWNELPDIELYMDQVITFIEGSIPMFAVHSREKIITPSMVNNYVKLKLIPKPVKRKYNKVHLAYLIAITILKHVFTIQEIRDGIVFQAELDGRKEAYNLFCQEQENAFSFLLGQMDIGDRKPISDMNINGENLTVKMATLAFASKIIAEKTIEIQGYPTGNNKGR